MSAFNHSRLATVCLLSIALLGSAPDIQTTEAPGVVGLPAEPHHHLVFENSFVRVYRVNIPGHDATLLHQHDLPYVSVSIGPADFVNAVAGKPEAHVVLADGQVGYSRGGFAHIARTDSGIAFSNVTIELLKPQGEPQNVCAKIIPGGALAASCPDAQAEQKKDSSSVAQFKTDEMSAQLDSYGSETHPVTVAPRLGTLVVIVSGSGIQKIASGKIEETLSAGNSTWLPAGSSTMLSNVSGKRWSALSLSFEDK